MALYTEQLSNGKYRSVVTNSGSNSGQSVFYTSYLPTSSKQLMNLGTRARVTSNSDTTSIAGSGSSSSPASSGSYSSIPGIGPVASSSSSDSYMDFYNRQYQDQLNMLNKYFSQAKKITAANNTWSAEQAEKQMDFQRESNREAMQFNHDEAELSRVWQERMSNTAHQREVQDLQAAGLNPVLSAMGGSGAPVTSGATASGYASSGSKGDTDTSLAPALVSLLGHFMGQQASIFNTITSAQTQERVAQMGYDAEIFRALTSAASAREVAGMQTNASRDIAGIQSSTSKDVANIYGDTSRDVAGLQSATSLKVASISAGATVSSAQIHANAQTAAATISGRYALSVAETNKLSNLLAHQMDNANRLAVSREGNLTQSQIASLNRDLQKELQSNGFDFDMSFAEDQYHKNLMLNLEKGGIQIGSDLLRGLTSFF